MAARTKEGLWLRWMTRRDLSEVLAIDREAFPGGPWDEGDWLGHLRDRNTIGRVAEYRGGVAAVILYRLREHHTEVLRLAVRADCRRAGLARKLLGEVRGKLDGRRRLRVLADVPERCLAAQLLLRSLGWEVIRTDRAAEVYRFAGYPD